MSAGRQRIVITVGLPGAGKSTYLEKLGVHALSSDCLRLLLADDVTNQTVNDRVFLAMRYLLNHRLAIGRPVTYVDATHLTAGERRPYVEIAGWYGCDLEALFFDLPLELCRQRNSARGRVVPEDALERLAGRLEPPSLAEGFTRITVIREPEL
ncbi:MAG: ATP-binding protein [Acidobacteria bacterium]|nr:ATP-binding protein [Acidobacteriota bacterium]